MKLFCSKLKRENIYFYIYLKLIFKMKNCNICGLDKPEADFSTGRNQCKICIREKKRNYYH